LGRDVKYLGDRLDLDGLLGFEHRGLMVLLLSEREGGVPIMDKAFLLIRNREMGDWHFDLKVGSLVMTRNRVTIRKKTTFIGKLQKSVTCRKDPESKKMVPRGILCDDSASILLGDKNFRLKFLKCGNSEV
jgi:hypothetical protein